MNKNDIIEKLKELGISTTNVYPKSSFVKDGDVHIGIFKREANEDFYFHNSFDGKIYKLTKPIDLNKYKKDVFNGNTKYLIPLHECKIIWEDKEYIELPDDQFSKMTMRQYACIQLRHPNSGLEWLDALIKEANDLAPELY